MYYYDVMRAPQDVEAEFKATYLSYEELLKTVDVISFHCPYTTQNHHLFNAEKIALMKKGAYVVNCSRGPVFNEADVVAALKSGQLGGAALDVFEFEPKISQELFAMENVVLTPHMGTLTRDARPEMAAEAMRGVKQVLEGEHPYNCVNPEVL